MKLQRGVCSHDGIVSKSELLEVDGKAPLTLLGLYNTQEVWGTMHVHSVFDFDAWRVRFLLYDIGINMNDKISNLRL